MEKLHKILGCVLLLIVSSMVAFSQIVPAARSGGAALTRLTLEELGNLDVTSVSKEPEPLRNTSAAIFVITQDDIRRSGATTIPEVLRLAPGIEVSQIDSSHWAVGVRGFQGQFSRSVLLLIDGRSVYTPLFAGVFWDVKDTLFEDIERIEVIRGPGGTIWGANAFNGVINIITRSAKDTHGPLVSLGGGNVDQAMGNFRQGGGNGQTFDYRAYAKFFTRGPQFHPDNRQFDDWRMGQFGFRADWSPSRRDALTLQGDIYKGETGEKVAVASFFPPSEPNLEGNDQVSGGNVRVQWRREWTEDSGTQVQAYYDRTNRIAPHFEEVRDTFDVDFLHHMGVPGRQKLSWGLGARLSPSTFTQVIPTLDFRPHDKRDSVYSFFAQDEIRIVPAIFSLTFGAKVERNDYTGAEVQPSVHLSWTPNPQRTFWAAVTRAVRTPSRLDMDISLKGFLLSGPPAIYLEIAGNPNFTSERLVGYEGGYRSLLASRFYLDVSVFHNQYRNLVSLGSSRNSVQTSPITYIQLSFPYVNGVRAVTDGFEISPEWDATSWWQLKGSYSYLHLDAKNEPGNSDISAVRNYEGSSARHRVVVQSRMSLPGSLELDQTYRYVSSLPAQSVSAYGTVDLRAGWRFAENFEFSVAGQNLLQPHHAEFGRSPAPLVETKRSIYAKITWQR